MSNPELDNYVVSPEQKEISRLTAENEKLQVQLNAQVKINDPAVGCPLERRVMPLVVVQTVWVRVSADYDSVARTRTLAVTPETTVGEVMRWAAAGNVLGRGDVVLTEQDYEA